MSHSRDGEATGVALTLRESLRVRVDRPYSYSLPDPAENMSKSCQDFPVSGEGLPARAPKTASRGKPVLRGQPAFVERFVCPGSLPESAGNGYIH